MINSVSYVDVIAEILGDVVKPFVPTVTMTVHYGNHEVINSTKVLALTAEATPRVLIGGEPNQLYTLIMFDPDAPSPSNPSLREVVSWIVTNIPGGTSAAQGTEFAEYEGPNPGKGVHRYIMLLYKQQSLLTEIEALPSRDCFKRDDFAIKHNLGTPVGVAYFYVRRQTRANARA